MIEKMKSTDFTTVALEDWKRVAESALNGKSFDSLKTITYENIQVKPLYTSEDMNLDLISQCPGQEDYRRGFQQDGEPSGDLQIANKMAFSSAQDLREKLSSALAKGQTSISFEAIPTLFKDADELTELFAHYSFKHPYNINARTLQTPLLGVLMKAIPDQSERVNLQGAVATDPIAEAALHGGFPTDVDKYYRDWTHTLRSADRELPNLKTILVDTTPFHNNGANAVQELGIAISSAVTHLQYLLQNGWDIKKALSKFIFQFSIGSDFFMEIAKLRAARILWNKTLEAYGVDPEYRGMVISGETSFFTKTIFDPYVNILRAGTETFAGIIGGVQFLHTTPFNATLGIPNDFSERIARNTQLIIKSEAHLEKVIDPSGGSWYIESLTNELAEKAWELFLDIDDKGGMIQALQSGWIQEEISKVLHMRIEDVSVRKKSIIGTNVYANLSEEFAFTSELKDQPMYFDGSIEEAVMVLSSEKLFHSELMKYNPKFSFPALSQVRLASVYENLRFKARNLETTTGTKPTVGLLCLGEVKSHKARAEFVSNMLAAGGIHCIKSQGITSINEAMTFAKLIESGHLFICGSEEDYDKFGLDLTREIKEKLPDILLYLAGNPSSDHQNEWKSAGMDSFIFRGCNIYEFLHSLLGKLEVQYHAKAGL